MAVEARHHLSLFPPPLLGNSREMMMNTIEANGNMYNTTPTPIGYGVLPPTTTETLLPMYGSPINNFVHPAKAAVKADSGLTYNLPVSRKRSRDFINPLLSFANAHNQTHQTSCGSFTFLGDDISLQIRQQQLEIDCFVAQHTEKVRVEIENRRKQNCTRMLAAMEEGIMKRLRVKEQEIEKIGNLNWALEEKVRSLCIENQIWRDLAQTNEATANALRCNLEQVLAQVEGEQHHGCGVGVDETAVESCCGSNYDCGEEEDRLTTLVENRGGGGGGGERKVVEKGDDDGTSTNSNSNSNSRWCKKCWKVESCVLLLPCRHLCVCTVCESTLHTCPICKSSKNASVHVNLSS